MKSSSNLLKIEAVFQFALKNVVVFHLVEKLRSSSLRLIEVMSVVDIFSFFTTSPAGRQGGWAAGEINTKANSGQLNWGWG